MLQKAEEMEKASKNRKKKVLLAEDEKAVRQGLTIALEPYLNYIEIVEVDNAGDALENLFSHDMGIRPDFLVLDLMMSYGEAKEVLDGKTDKQMVESGIRLLKYLREREKPGFFSHHPLFVSVITTRNDPRIVKRLLDSLGDWGKIYTKPFDEDEFINDMMLVLGIESKVNPDLLPPEYTKPVNIYGGVS